MRDNGESIFRRWLIDKVKRSRWPTFKDDTPEAIGQRIGVQPEIIIQAQRELAEERIAQGKAPLRLGTGRTRRKKRRWLDIDMPKDVHQDWLLYCRTRDLPASTVLRSLVQTLLSGPENPTWLGRVWRYRGRMLRLVGYKEFMRSGWPYNVKTDVPEGAVRALTIRASGLGCTMTALVRGAVIDLLEGRTKRLNIVNSPDAMWEDENRYWTGQRQQS
jgi:hypothetical protein